MKIAGIQNQGHLISTIVWWIGWTSEQNIDGNVVKIVHKTKIHLGYTFPVMYAYTASKHEGTLCTPNRMMLGREIRLPINIMYPMKESCVQSLMWNGWDKPWSKGNSIWLQEGVRSTVLWSASTKQVPLHWWVGVEMVPTGTCLITHTLVHIRSLTSMDL